MSQGRSRGKVKGVEEFRPYVTRSLPVGAQIICADNSGAKILEIIMVTKTKTRVSRLPAAAVGDYVNVVVKKGPAELRKQVHGAIIVRQKYAIRRLNGVRVTFEDNAAVLSTPEGEARFSILLIETLDRRLASLEV